MAIPIILVETKGFQEVDLYLSKMKNKSIDLSPAMKKAGQQMMLSVRKNFAQGGRPKSWKSVSGKYQIKKFRSGYGTKTLIRTGNLQRSIVPDYSRNSVVIGTSLKYAATHQFGDTRRNIPKRTFLMFQQDDISRIKQLVLEHILRK